MIFYTEKNLFKFMVSALADYIDPINLKSIYNYRTIL